MAREPGRPSIRWRCCWCSLSPPRAAARRPAAHPLQGCDKYCGSGSATVTFGGATERLSGGGCIDGGPAGIDAKFGDWQGVTDGTSGYLILTAYRPGGSTPAQAPPLHRPDTGPASPAANGSVNGQPFVLGPGAVVAITPDETGSFSGTDVNGCGQARGTFRCH